MVAAFERSSKYKGKIVSKKITGKEQPGRFITISGRQRAEESELDIDVRNDVEEPLVVQAESSKYVSSALGNLLRAEPPKAATEKVASSKKGSKKKNKKASTEKATEAGNRKETKAAASIASSIKQKDLQKRGRSRSTPRKPRPRSQSPELEARKTSPARKHPSELAGKKADAPPLEKQKPTTPHRGTSIGRNQSASKRTVATPKRGRSIAADQIPSKREKSTARRSEKNQRERSVVGKSTRAHHDHKSGSHGQVPVQRERSIVAELKKKATAAVPSSSHSASDSDASAIKVTGSDQSKGNISKDSSTPNLIGRNQSVSKRTVTPKRGRSIVGDQIPSKREKSTTRRSEKNQRERSVVGGSTRAHQDHKSGSHGQVTVQRERSIVAELKKKATAVPSSSHSASGSDASAIKVTGSDQSKGNISKDSSSKVEKSKQERSNGRSSPAGPAAVGDETDGKSKSSKSIEGYELIAVRTKDGSLTAGILTKKGTSANTEDRETQDVMDGTVGRNKKKPMRSESPFDQSMSSQIEGDVDERPYEEKQAQHPAMSWEGLWAGFPAGFPARFISWSTGEKDPRLRISESPPSTISETIEHDKKEGLPRKGLAAKIMRVRDRDRGHIHYDDRSLPVVSCPVGHKRRDAKNSHPSKNFTRGRSSPTFPLSSGNPHREPKAPSSDGDSITSENAPHATKQLTNELMSLTSAASDSDEKTVKIENHAWGEIVQAAKTLDKKFIDVAKDGSNYFFSNAAINEINTALAKIRKHATHLNIDEKDLIAAAQDDDETKLKTLLCRESPINHQLKIESQVDGWVDMIKSYFDGANCATDKGKCPSKKYDKESSVGTGCTQSFEGRLLSQF